MIISYKRKLRLIKTAEEFVSFCIKIKILNNFKELTQEIELKINDFVYSEQKFLFKGFKKNCVNKIFYSNTILLEQYWIDRGFTKEESKTKIKEEQVKRSNMGVKTLAELKINNYPKWAKTKTTNIEYYINKGLSSEEAKEKLSERQTTFSLEICIEKHGEIEGTKIWEERQQKWIKTLSNKSQTEIESINIKKDSNSIQFFKKKYNNNWLYYFLNEKYCQDNQEKKKDFLWNAFTKNGTLENFSIFVSENIEYLGMSDVEWVFKSAAVQEVYSVTYDEIKNSILKNYGATILRQGRYGIRRFFDGHIFKSLGEYKIAELFADNNVNYEYEKKYPFQNKGDNSRYDFYIPALDLYVEYCGMIFKKINEEYSNKIEKKKKHCEKHKLNSIFESDYKEIIKSLKTQLKIETL